MATRTRTNPSKPARSADKENQEPVSWEGMTQEQIEISAARQESAAYREEIEKQQDELIALMNEIKALKAKAGANLPTPADERADDNEGTDALAQERAKTAALQKELDKLRSSGDAEPSSDKIPRPAGSAGNNFNIQNEMGLGGSAANREIYKALMRNLRDLALQAGVQWECPWAEVPASEKAKLFDVARARHPILENYVNDWATAEIIKQYFKNKRKNGYKSGWLEAPQKFRYLKNNSAKRDPSASRKRRTVDPATAKTVVQRAAKKAGKKAATVRGSGSKAASSSNGKGKGKAVAILKKKVVKKVDLSEEEEMEDDVAEASEEDSET
ncbi:hypothetical protein C8R45DRAFT_1216404 [Mycena sanguinolenta]|nr:hypothetical protein C8R45DRAFT_1216404 [Mycena sanguinolenta]